MSLYFFCILLLISGILISSLLVYIRYRKTSWLFFVIFSMCLSIWYILYIVSFNPNMWSEIILIIYRFQYGRQWFVV